MHGSVCHSENIHICKVCLELEQNCVHTQLGPTLCDHMFCSPQVPSCHGIFQARILEWVVIFYSRRSSWPRDWTCISCISCIGRRILYHQTIRETVSPSTSCLSGPENSCSSWIKLFWMSFPPRYLTKGKQEPRLQIISTDKLSNTV